MSFDQISKNIHSELIVVQRAVKLDQLEELFQKYFESNLLDYSQNLLSAFLHKSFTHEFTLPLADNEKLEFLGDSVLQLIISEKLFKIYPDKNEGELSKLRSAIVNENTLSELATMLKLEKWVLLGKGELKEQGHSKASIQANTFEAVLGAVYLDHGMPAAEKFLNAALNMFQTKNGKSLLDESILISFDPKTTLQELVMKKYKTTPNYVCTSIKEGKSESFNVELRIEEKVIDSLLHSSKKKGMQILAKKVLDNNLI